MVAYRKSRVGPPNFGVRGKADLCHLDLYPVHRVILLHCTQDAFWPFLSAEHLLCDVSHIVVLLLVPSPISFPPPPTHLFMLKLFMCASALLKWSCHGRGERRVVAVCWNFLCDHRNFLQRLGIDFFVPPSLKQCSVH